MEIVATLVCDPDVLKLDEKLISMATTQLTKNGAQHLNTSILSKNEAVDVIFSGLSANEAQKLLLEVFSEQPIDIFCGENINRKKKMLVADMDSTILTVECIDEIADMMGIKDKVSAITESAMRGELDFSNSLKERVALLTGLDANKLDEVYKTRIKYSKGSKTLVQTMKKHGADSYLISGGFTYFSEKVAAKTGFAQNHANVLEIKDGKLTGKVSDPVVDAQTKRDVLLAAQEKNKLQKDDILAVGDGANDIPMIQEAGLGVAYMAKPKTQEQAQAVVRHTSLKTLLFYQGYKNAELVK